LRYTYTQEAAALGRRIIAALQIQMYERLAAMPLEFFTTLRGGAAGTRLTTEVYATEPLFTRVLVALVANVMTLIGALVVLISVDARLALALLLLPLVFKPVGATEDKIRQLLRAQTGLNTEIATAADSLLSTPGMTLARQSGQLPREVSGFGNIVDQLRDRATKLAEAGNRIMTGYNLALGVVASVVFGAGAWLVSIGELSLGTLVLFLLYIRQVQMPITALSGLRYEALRAAQAFTRVFEVLDSDLNGDFPPGTVGQEPPI